MAVNPAAEAQALQAAELAPQPTLPPLNPETAVEDRVSGYFEEIQQEEQKPLDPFEVISQGASQVWQGGRVGQDRVHYLYESFGRMTTPNTLAKDDVSYLDNKRVLKGYVGNEEEYTRLKDENDSIFLNALSDAVSMTPAMMKMAEEGVVAGAAFGTGGAVTAAAPVAALGPQVAVPAAAGGFVSGAAVGFPVGMFHSAYVLSAGEIYDDMIHKGADKKTAASAAVSGGLVMAAIEVVQIGSLGRLAGGAAKAVLRSKVFQQQFTRQAKDYLLAVGEQVTEEAAQELVKDVTEIVAGMLDDSDTEFMTWDQTVQNIQQTVVDSIGPSAFLVGGSKVAGRIAGETIRRTGADTKINDLVAQARENLEQAYDAEVADKQAIVTDGGVQILEGRVVLEQEDFQELSLEEGPTDEQIAAAEAETVQPEVSEAAQAAEQVLDVPADEVQEALDALFGETRPQAVDTPSGKPLLVDPVQIELTELSPEERSNRLNEIRIDSRVVQASIKQRQRQIKEKTKQGLPVEAEQQQVQTLQQAYDTLQFERDMIEQGLTSFDVQELSRFGRAAEMVTLISGQAKQAAILTGRATETQTRAEVQSLQRRLVKVIEEANVPQKDKTKLLRSVVQANTPTRFLNASRKVQQRLRQFAEADAKRQVRTRINKLLKRARTRKVGKREVAKFPADIQTRLDMYRDFNKDAAKRSEAIDTWVKKQNEHEQNPTENPAPTQDETFAFELANRMQDLQGKTAAELSALADELANLIEEGKTQAEQIAAQRKAEREATQKIAEESVSAGWDQTPNTKSTAKRLWDSFELFLEQSSGLPGILDFLSQNDPNRALVDMMDAHGATRNFLRNESTTMAALTDQMQAALNEAGSRKDLYSRFIEDSDADTKVKLEYEINQNRAETFIKPPTELTKSEWMYYYTLFHSAEVNNNAKQALVDTGFTFIEDAGDKSTEAALNRALDGEDKAVALSIVNFFDGYFNRINEFHRNKYGTSMIKEERYVPMLRTGVNVDAARRVLQNFRMQSTMPVSAIRRTENRFPLETQDLYRAALGHIMDWEHTMAYADLNQKMADVLSSGRFRKVISSRYNKGFNKLLDEYQLRFLSGNPYGSRNLDVGFIDWFRKALVPAKLAGKTVKQVLTQLSSISPYFVDIPLMELPGAMFKNAMTLPSTAKQVFDSPIHQERWRNKTRDISEFMNSNMYASLRKQKGWRDYLMAGVTLGDAANVVLGGGTLYNHLRSKGVAHEDAVIAVERVTTTTQQSSHLDQLSWFETQNAVTRIATAFGTQQRQLWNATRVSWRKFSKSDKTAADYRRFIKEMAAYHVMPAVTYSLVGMLPVLLFKPGGMDEEDIDEAISVSMRTGLLGSLNGPFVLGHLAEMVWVSSWAAAFGTKGFVDTDDTIASELVKDPLNFISAVNKAYFDEPESLAELSAMLAEPEAPEAELLRKGVDALDIFGVPQMAVAPLTAYEMFLQDDPLGAAFALGGYGTGSVKRRVEKPLTSFSQLEKELSGEQPSFMETLLGEDVQQSLRDLSGAPSEIEIEVEQEEQQADFDLHSEMMNDIQSSLQAEIEALESQLEEAETQAQNSDIIETGPAEAADIQRQRLFGSGE